MSVYRYSAEFTDPQHLTFTLHASNQLEWDALVERKLASGWKQVTPQRPYEDSNQEEK